MADVQLGGAVIDFRADPSDLNRGTRSANRGLRNHRNELRKTGRRYQQTSQQAAAASKAIRGVAAGLGLAVAGGGLLSLARNAISTGTALRETAVAAGTTVETLQDLRFVAESDGVAMQQLDRALIQLNRSVGEALMGTTTYVDALSEIGLTARELNELSLEERFLAIANGIRELGDRARQTSVAQALFSRAGVELLPVLVQSQEQIRGTIARSQELGNVTDENAAALKEFDQTLTDINKNIQANLTNSIGTLVRLIQDVDSTSRQAERSVDSLITRFVESVFSENFVARFRRFKEAREEALGIGQAAEAAPTPEAPENPVVTDILARANELEEQAKLARQFSRTLTDEATALEKVNRASRQQIEIFGLVGVERARAIAEQKIQNTLDEEFVRLQDIIRNGTREQQEAAKRELRLQTDLLANRSRYVANLATEIFLQDEYRKQIEKLIAAEERARQEAIDRNRAFEEANIRRLQNEQRALELSVAQTREIEKRTLELEKQIQLENLDREKERLRLLDEQAEARNQAFDDANVARLQNEVKLEEERLRLLDEQAEARNRAFEAGNISRLQEEVRLEEERLRVLDEQAKARNEAAEAANVQRLQDELRQQEEAYARVQRQAEDFASVATGAIFDLIQGTREFDEVLLNIVNNTLSRLIEGFIQAQVEALLLNKTLSTLGSGSGGGGIFGFIGGLLGFQRGGRPPIGRPSIVGEAGPELFVPDTSGTIVPNNQLGGRAINFTYAPSIPYDPAGISRAVRSEYNNFEALVRSGLQDDFPRRSQLRDSVRRG